MYIYGPSILHQQCGRETCAPHHCQHLYSRLLNFIYGLDVSSASFRLFLS